MNNASKIINNLLKQADSLYMVGIQPSRVILGIEVVKILKAYVDTFVYSANPKDNFLFMGLPVTIDYDNKWILMACAGNECDGEFWLDGHKEKESDDVSMAWHGTQNKNCGENTWTHDGKINCISDYISKLDPSEEEKIEYRKELVKNFDVTARCKAYVNEE